MLESMVLAAWISSVYPYMFVVLKSIALSLSLSTYTYTDIDSAKKNQVQRINSIFYPRKLNSRCDPPWPIGSLGPKPFFGCLVVVLWDEPMNLTMTSRRFRHHPSYLKGLWISTIQPEKKPFENGDIVV